MLRPFSMFFWWMPRHFPKLISTVTLQTLHLFRTHAYFLKSFTSVWNYKNISNNCNDQNKNGAQKQPCWGGYITNVTLGMEISTQLRYVSGDKPRNGHKNHRRKSSVDTGVGLHLVVILIYFILLKCNIRRTHTSGGFGTRLKTTSAVAVQ
jgi:hypothetical protein